MPSWAGTLRVLQSVFRMQGLRSPVRIDTPFAPASVAEYRSIAALQFPGGLFGNTALGSSLFSNPASLVRCSPSPLSQEEPVSAERARAADHLSSQIGLQTRQRTVLDPLRQSRLPPQLPRGAADRATWHCDHYRLLHRLRSGVDAQCEGALCRQAISHSETSPRSNRSADCKSKRRAPPPVTSSRRRRTSHKHCSAKASNVLVQKSGLGIARSWCRSRNDWNRAASQNNCAK